MVIVDTTVWIDFFRGTENPETAWLDSNLDRQRLGLTDLVLCEVLQGISDDGSFRKVQQDLCRFEIFEAGGVDMAISAVRNFQTLRRRGCTVRRTVDCWIATFCIRRQHMLLHRDRDFDPFERLLGLRVVHP